ncbi:hypothetical protein K474DRAFT_1707486 [Panus rudis PR-1116 ss-1]|nr:hypothetical protein K474DRAFT_1707486 [Panus rudis PR-1116 ss-1]
MARKGSPSGSRTRSGRPRKVSGRLQEMQDREAEKAEKKAEQARKAQEKADRAKKGLTKPPSTKAKNAARQDANDEVPGAAGSITMRSINLVSKKTTGMAALATDTSASEPSTTAQNHGAPANTTGDTTGQLPPVVPAMSANKRAKPKVSNNEVVAPPKKPNTTSMNALPSGPAVQVAQQRGAATALKKVPPIPDRSTNTTPTNAKPTTPGQARHTSVTRTTLSQVALSRSPLPPAVTATNAKLTAPTGQVPGRSTIVVGTVPPRSAPPRSPLPPVTATNTKSTLPGQAHRALVKPLVKPFSQLNSGMRSTSNGPRATSTAPGPRLAPSRMATPPIPPQRILGRTNSFEDAGPQPSLDDVKKLFSQTLSPEQVDHAFNTFQTLIAVQAGGTGRDAVTAAFADSLTIASHYSEGKKRARSASSAAEVFDTEDQPRPPKVEKLATPPIQEGHVNLLKETAADIYRSKMFIQSFYPQKTDEWITATFNAACKELNIVGAVLSSDLATQIHRTGSIYRSNLKDHGRHIATQAYGLRAGREERNVLRVAALLANDTYIYPKSDMKRPPRERSLSYQHEGIALFIKRTWFNNHGSLGVRRGEHLTEIPKAAIAFAATMICFSIGQWSTGKFVGTSFNENEWKKVYLYHETRLTAFENDGRQAEMSGEINLYTKFAQDMLYDSRIHAGVEIPINAVAVDEDAQEAWADEYSRRRDAMLGLGSCSFTNDSNGDEANPLDSSDDEDEILEMTDLTVSGNSETLGDVLEDEASDFEAQVVVHERVPKRVKKKKKAVAALSDEGEASEDERKSEGADSENYQELATNDVADVEEGAGGEETEVAQADGEAEHEVDGQGYQVDDEVYNFDEEGVEGDQHPEYEAEEEYSLSADEDA